jgi:hypothetical protein
MEQLRASLQPRDRKGAPRPVAVVAVIARNTAAAHLGGTVTAP